MKYSSWKDVAELIGVAAIVASLLFVGQQIRLERNIAQADAWLQWVDTQVSLAQLIGDNKEVWSRGLDGQELSDVDQWTFNQIAYAIDQKHASRFVGSNSGIRRGAAEDVVIQYAELLFLYPGLRQFYESRRELKVRRSSLPEFDASVTEQLSKLDDGEVEPPERTGQAF